MSPSWAQNCYFHRLVRKYSMPKFPFASRWKIKHSQVIHQKGFRIWTTYRRYVRMVREYGGSGDGVSLNRRRAIKLQSTLRARKYHSQYRNPLEERSHILQSNATPSWISVQIKFVCNDPLVEIST
jgi:hypothetical protein